MSIFTGISLIMGFVCIILGFIVEGGSPGDLLSKSAALIVFGGTLAALCISFSEKDILKFPKVFKVAFKKVNNNYDDIINFFIDIIQKTRKNGLLAMENEIDAIEDPFIKSGLQMVVDGIDEEQVRNILEAEVFEMSRRHKVGADMFEYAGGFSPTMGIVGTVTGLVNILGNLTDASALGPKIAAAFIATLYGIGFANLFWLPIANKLRQINLAEVKRKELIIESICSVQEGLNPYLLKKKLYSLLAEDVPPEDK